MPAPSFAGEPQVQYLHQVLDQLHRGELLIPDFQRPPRWDDDQRKRLLESVSSGYPIGSLMVWRTSREVPYRREVGGLDVEAGVGSTRQYLLDGFQRMSTLLAALRSDEDTPTGPDGDGHRWALGYHLVHEEWLFVDDIDEGDRPVVLPGRVVLQSVELLRFQRKLMEHTSDEELLRRSDLIATAFREYKLPLIPVVTDDVEEAIQTFGLLNTEGTKMSDLDLVVALTWRDDYDLRGRLDDAKEQLGRVGWQELDEKYILASLRTEFGLDLYDKNAKELGERLRAEPARLESAVSSLVQAGAFLADECAVVALGLLPYSYQAVIVGDVLRGRPNPPARLRRALKQWFWWTTVWASFAGISGYRMREMSKYLHAIAKGSDAPWPWRLAGTRPQRLPSAADPRSARIRALAIELYERQGAPRALRRRLESQAARALVRGLTGLGSSLARDPGNAFLVSDHGEQSLVAALWARARGSTEYEHPLFFDPDARAAHLITDDAWDALGQGNASVFVRLRREALERHEMAFLTQLGLPPGVPDT